MLSEYSTFEHEKNFRTIGLHQKYQKNPKDLKASENFRHFGMVAMVAMVASPGMMVPSGSHGPVDLGAARDPGLALHALGTNTLGLRLLFVARIKVVLKLLV